MYPRRVPHYGMNTYQTTFAFMTWQGDRSPRVHGSVICASVKLVSNLPMDPQKPRARYRQCIQIIQGRSNVHDRTSHFDKSFPINLGFIFC